MYSKDMTYLQENLREQDKIYRDGSYSVYYTL